MVKILPSNRRSIAAAVIAFIQHIINKGKIVEDGSYE